MIVLQRYYLILVYIPVSLLLANLSSLVQCSSAPPITTTNNSNKLQGANQSTATSKEESVDDILKDTIQLLDVLDKKLVQVNNRTQKNGPLMRGENLRLLELDQTDRDDEELMRIADKFSSERQIVANFEQLTAQSSNQNEQKLTADQQQQQDEHSLMQNLGTRRLRQLSLGANTSHFDNDFTDRHLQFSLDLMQALLATSAHDSNIKQRNSQLESFLISPVSIQMVLMMMHLGARGQTKRELANCLHLPSPFDITSSSSPLGTQAPPTNNKLWRRNPAQQQKLQSGGPKRSSPASSSVPPNMGQSSGNNVHELFGAAMKNLLKDPSVVKALTSASQMFLQRELSLASQYEQAVRHYYGVELKPVDFQQRPANSSSPINATSSSSAQHNELSVQQLINDWVERQTKGKISNFLASPVPSSTLLMAINVLFFKGDWQYKFDPADTDPDAWFTMANGKTVKVPMMVNRLPLAHAYDAAMKTSVIELPYKAQRLGLFVLLPDEADGVFNTMRQLNATTFANLISMMRKSAPGNAPDSATSLAGINVRIPKFTIESSPRLSQILSQQLGLKTLFSPDVADLSGMFDRTSGSGNNQRRSASNVTNPAVPQVGLDELMHKAVLQVHELGSVAAAASATIVERVGLFNGQYFEADHPFLMFLMDKQTGLVLFSGIFAGTSNATGGSEQSHSQQLGT